MMKKLLLVDDDDSLRTPIKEVLESAGFLVDEAENGLVARQKIKETRYDAIISDIQMPEMTGTELVEWVRNIYDLSFKGNKELPIILVTGFAHIAETQHAHELGVQEFLPKPFKAEELISSVNQVLGIKEESDNVNIDEENVVPDFCKVSLEDFVTDRENEMDVYVKLSEKKFIKIAHKGGKIDLNRVDNYKKKGLKHLYIKREDFRKVLDFNVMLSKVVANSDQVSIEKKKRFVAYTASIIVENISINGIDKRSFGEAKEFFLSTFDVLSEDQETLDLLNIMSDHSDLLYVHSLGTSIYSVMIAKELGWKSTATLFKLQFGGLMHDIGKKEFPQALIEKPRNQLTYDERKSLESHTFRGKEILQSLKSAPAEVVAIAFEHHENNLSMGFPRQLDPRKLHPMSKVVSVANEFCNYALKNPNNPGMEAQKALHLLETYKKDELDPEALTALKNLIARG